MKIKREKGFDEVTFRFRLLNLNEQEIDLVKVFIGNKLKYDIFEQYGNIIFSFKNKKEARYICGLIDKFERSQKNIFISILSSHDHGGLSVPDYVLDIVRDKGISLDFSYIIY